MIDVPGAELPRVSGYFPSPFSYLFYDLGNRERDMTMGDVIILLMLAMMFTLFFLLLTAIVRGLPGTRRTDRQSMVARGASTIANTLALWLLLLTVFLSILAGYMIW